MPLVEGLLLVRLFDVTAQFDQKLLELLQQALVQISLGVALRQVQKFDQVAVLEHAQSIGMHLRQHCPHFCRTEHHALKQGCFELAHPKQAGPGKTTQFRLGSGQMFGQLRYHTIPPLRLLNLAADGLADLPIQLDQGGVDR